MTAAEPGPRTDELALAARAWRVDLPVVRRGLEAEAGSLARPRLWIDTVGPLAATSWRMLTIAAPDAPIALLSAAAAAAGLPIGPPPESWGVLRRAQRLVRSGGPTYIKLGQFIASARGLLPDVWVDAFAWCRDDVPAMEYEVVRETLRLELPGRARPVRLSRRPLAAASIAQVHTAELRDGTPVVVKVRRPGLRRRVRSDIGVLALAAAAAERYSDDAAAANLTGFVELFAQLVLQELDFRLEALNLVDSAASFQRLGMDYVDVPAPIPGMVTERVLVMERMEGIPYDRAPAVLGERLDGDRLLRLAIEGVIRATLLDGLFHGDLHAGNVLVAEDGRHFALVDFGIYGRLDARQRAGLVSYLAGFAASDARMQIEAMQGFGALPADVDVDALVAQLQVELDRLDAREDGAVTFERLGQAIGRLLRVLAANGFTMPKDLVLFFKNLLYLSGFAASISPESDLFEHVTAVLGDVFAEQQAPQPVSALDGGGEPDPPRRRMLPALTRRGR